MDIFEMFLVIGSVVAFFMSIFQVAFILMAVQPVPFDIYIMLSVGAVVTLIASIIFGMYGFRVVVPKQEKENV